MKRRQVGFIRNYSAKDLSNIGQQPSEFSYFRLKKHHEDDEFSPYEFEDHQQSHFRQPINKNPPKPPKSPKATISMPYRSSEAHPKTAQKNPTQIPTSQNFKNVYNEIRQQYQKHQSQRINQNIKLKTNINQLANKIETIDQQIYQMKVKGKVEQQIQIEEEEVEEEEDQISKAVKRVVGKEGKIRQMIRNKKYLEQECSSQNQQQEQEQEDGQNEGDSRPMEDDNSSEESSQIQMPIRMSKAHKQTLPQIRHPPPSSSQSSHYSDPVPPKQTSNKIRKQTSQTPPEQDFTQTKNDYYKNKGGICFQVDVKQFTKPQPQPQNPRNYERIKKPLNKIDQKKQLLKRREMAKAYGQYARMVVFNQH